MALYQNFTDNGQKINKGSALFWFSKSNQNSLSTGGLGQIENTK
jgi:hypothetical protein